MESRIIADLKDRYGLVCEKITPVAGGWLNQKWKVSAGQCDVFVKKFSRERFGLNKLELIESALQRQVVLEKQGVPCPAVRRCDGRAIRLLDNETAYMVMDFRPGKVENADTITEMQMLSLGDACGFMHKAFSQLPSLSVEGFPLDEGQILDLLWNNHRARVHACPSGAPAEYRDAVLAQEPILKQLEVSFFERIPKGIAHEDFSSDNILFEKECVSAIVDFDRNHYSHLWHDVGRAVLSFALKDDQINLEKASAFVEGYSRHLALTLPDIADALRLSWCIETPWWIRPEFFQENREKVVRFKDEMLWLTEHWFALDDLLGC